MIDTKNRMFKIIIGLVTFGLYSACGTNTTNQPQYVHPDFGLNVRQLILKHGYPFENHTVITEDGYILEIHRIAYGRYTNVRAHKRRPVLIVPGILSSSADWVNMGPEKSLGFILADQGYDVWLANYRGTRWSRKHIKYNPDVDWLNFWSYSFHQIGYYDLPAFIDHILWTTQTDGLIYIGHSQGTTSLFALASTRSEYNKKIRLAVALSPVVRVDHTTTPFIQMAALFQNEIEHLLILQPHLYEVLPYRPELGNLASVSCNDRSTTQGLCATIFFITGGHTPKQLNKTMIPVIASNSPAGGSIKQVQHYAQLYNSKQFRQYDYGEPKNQIIYGQLTPPNYNLGKVTVPVAFYYGSEDPFCEEEDVNLTAAQLPNLIISKRIIGFNHLDVLWGIDAKVVLYNHILKLLKSY